MHCGRLAVLGWVTFVAGQAFGVSPIEQAKGEIFTKLLTQILANGSHTVIYSKSDSSQFNLRDKRELNRKKRQVARQLKIPGYNPGSLVQALFALNANSTGLGLLSSKKDGFLIDYDGHYRQWVEGSGGGWDKLRKNDPQADGLTTLSLPVIDKKQNIVLIYIGRNYDELMGSGNIVAFKWEKGVFREISRVMLWIS